MMFPPTYQPAIHIMLDLGNSLAKPGQHLYRLVAGNTLKDEQRIVLQYKYGWNNFLSTSLYFASRTPDEENCRICPEKARRWGSALHWSWGGWFSNAHVFLGDEKRIVGIDTITQMGKMSLFFEHVEANGVKSDLLATGSRPLIRHTKARLGGALLLWKLPALNYGLELTRQEMEDSGTSTELLNRFSLRFSPIKSTLSHNISWRKTSQNPSSSTGDIKWKTRFSKRYRTRATLTYNPKSHFFDSLGLRFDSRFQNELTLSFDVNHSFSNYQTNSSINLSKKFKQFTLGMGTTYALNGSYSLNFNLFTSFGREPRKKNWFFSGKSAIDGKASVRAFVDENLNGRWDAGEQPLENTEILLDQRVSKEFTNMEGLVLLTDLQSDKPIDISLSESKLDIDYTPRPPAVNIVPRSGKVAVVDLPVVFTGEVEGTAYLQQTDGKKQEAGGVQFELLDTHNQVVQKTTSAFDGFFLFESLLPGQYRLRISPEQVERLKLPPSPVQTLTVDGGQVFNVEFIFKNRR